MNVLPQPSYSLPRFSGVYRLSMETRNHANMAVIERLTTSDDADHLMLTEHERAEGKKATPEDLLNVIDDAIDHFHKQLADAMGALDVVAFRVKGVDYIAVDDQYGNDATGYYDKRAETLETWEARKHKQGVPDKHRDSHFSMCQRGYRAALDSVNEDFAKKAIGDVFFEGEVATVNPFNRKKLARLRDAHLAAQAEEVLT